MSQGDVRGMARGSALGLVLSVVAQGCAIGVTLLLARRFGPADVGRYAQAQALMALLGLIALGGLRAGLTRFVATHRADGDMDAVHGTVRAGLLFATVASIVFGTALIGLAKPLAVHAFHDPALADVLRIVGVTLPFAALTDSALAASQGFRRMRAYAVVQLLVEPALRISLTAVLVALGAGLHGAVFALLISNGIGAVLALGALSRQLGRPTGRIRYCVSELLRFSAISWFASMASTGLIWADTVLLGILAKNTDVGVYNVATRLVMLAAFVMIPINQAVGPRIAHLSHVRDPAPLQQVYRVATSWMVRLSLPAFIALLAFPDELLRLFGGAFATGATVTVIFALGKLVDAASGPCAVMLNMAGRPAYNMAANVFALVLNVALNVALIPRYGVTGAAVAWTVSLVVVNAIRLVAVWRVLGVLPFEAGTARSLLAAGGSLGLAESLHSAIGTGPAAAIALLAYAGSIALSTGADDRAALLALVERKPARAPGVHRPAAEVRTPLAAPLPLAAAALLPPATGATLPPAVPAPLPPATAVTSVPRVRGCGRLRAHPSHLAGTPEHPYRCPGIEARSQAAVR